MYAHLTTSLQLLKPHKTAQRKALMLKHGHIRNHHTQISKKKAKKNFKKNSLTTFFIE